MKGKKAHQYTSHELGMRVVLLLQKSRTRDARVAAAIIKERFGVHRSTAYRLVAHAGAAMGIAYNRENNAEHVSRSVGYPRAPEASA